jgi:cyclopropane-fatty-acyl-phospholipid synthase
MLNEILESGLVPEWLIRCGIRQLLATKLRELEVDDVAREQQSLMDFVEELKNSPIAIHTEDANSQHYEVPTEFFRLVLGRHMKYSSCLWCPGETDLNRAEEQMLELVCQRAEIKDGQDILDLGCGWGSMTLFLAKKYPNAQIVGLSNSRTQAEYINAQALAASLSNVRIITANIANFDSDLQFDRVVSIEMFEHMKNYKMLLEKISRWLKPEGKLFIHIFSHRDYAYHYDDKDGSDWLTRYFFLGGTMPADNLLLYFQDDLKITNHWVVDGTHYEKTANAWLLNMSANRHAIMSILSDTYGSDRAKLWWLRWRVFFLSCAELWGYENGQQWFVSHYLFEKSRSSSIITDPRMQATAENLRPHQKS